MSHNRSRSSWKFFDNLGPKQTREWLEVTTSCEPPTVTEDQKWPLLGSPDPEDIALSNRVQREYDIRTTELQSKFFPYDGCELSACALISCVATNVVCALSCLVVTPIWKGIDCCRDAPQDQTMDDEIDDNRSTFRQNTRRR